MFRVKLGSTGFFLGDCGFGVNGSWGSRAPNYMQLPGQIKSYSLQSKMTHKAQSIAAAEKTCTKQCPAT